ncbi:MAG: zinc-binding alcohol dehydrogenase [Chloroflexota bacterium]|nr:zinc-binding alcohol dehydrogenase [Chloroflexota bacterium]
MRGHRVVVTAPGQVELEWLDPPRPQRGQVLLRALSTLISPGTERAFFLNLENTNPAYPLYPGYSFVGEVIAAAEDVVALKIGDRVVCRAAHQSHALVEADSCLRAPSEVADEAAAFFALLAIAMQGLRKARIELGESVVVLGAGIVGVLAMRMAQLSGGLPVIGVDLDQRRLELARQIAADEALINDDNLLENLRAMLGAEGADVVIELTGAPAAVATAFQLARARGRVALVGSTRGISEGVNFYRDVHKKGLLVIGGHESAQPRQDSSPGYWTPDREYALCLDLLARGRVQTAPLISHRYNWREFPLAYARLASWDKDVMGMIIEWD